MSSRPACFTVQVLGQAPKLQRNLISNNNNNKMLMCEYQSASLTWLDLEPLRKHISECVCAFPEKFTWRKMTHPECRYAIWRTGIPDWKEEKRRKPEWSQYLCLFASCLWIWYDRLSYLPSLPAGAVLSLMCSLVSWTIPSKLWAQINLSLLECLCRVFCNSNEQR